MSRRSTRTLDCVACQQPVKDVGDHAVGVLCHRCVGTEEGWQRYEAWKRGQERPRRERRPIARKEPDALDLEIDKLEREIRSLAR